MASYHVSRRTPPAQAGAQVGYTVPHHTPSVPPIQVRERGRARGG
uniref:Uncharacterized protein n=1 Tax=Arundo donax TaxID=35708 RepID=A0A0A8Y8V5_ARUDO